MIDVQNVHDINDRRQVKIDQTAEDHSSHWIINLLTADLPPQFVNTNNRQVSMRIIDGTTAATAQDPNTLCMPVVVVATAKSNEQTKTYYRQKYEGSSGIAPSLDLNGYDVVNNDQAKTIEDPHIMFTFNVVDAAATANVTAPASADTQQFTGSGQSDQDLDLRAASDRPHVDRNENANGGLDLRPGDVKNDQAESQREGAQFSYQQS